MARVGQITSGGAGVSLWHLRDVEISHGDEFCALGPIFTHSGAEYEIGLRKQNDSYCVQTDLARLHHLPLPAVSFEFQLTSGKERVSHSHSVTPDGRTHYVTCGVDVEGYLKERGNRVLFPGLTLSLRMHPERKFASCAIQTDVSLRDTEDLEKLQTDLKKLVLSENDSDVTLQVQGREFPAHKAILRARSPVFDAMLGHDMAEKLSGGVTIEDCDPKTFPDFLRYLYTGSTEHLSQGNVCHLYTASDKYEVLGLKAQCTEFMKMHLSTETFCDFLTLALKHQEGDLVRAATEFFCDNTVEIVQSVEWQIFQQNNVTAVNELVLKAVSRLKTI